VHGDVHDLPRRDDRECRAAVDGVAALGALFTHQVIGHFVDGAQGLGLDAAAARALGPAVASTGAQAVASLPSAVVEQATNVAKSAFVKGLDETLWVKGRHRGGRRGFVPHRSARCA
jgi:hypothetical protein